MVSETVIAKRFIIDHKVASSLRPHAIEITKPVLKTFRSEKENIFKWTQEASASHLWWNWEIKTSIKAERKGCQNDGWWVW